MVQLVENLVKIFTSGKFMSIFTSGLLMTVEMSLGAAVLGLVLGTVVALVNLSKSKSPLMVLPRVLCKIYITVIRGTPMALQLFIMAFVIITVRGFPQVLVAIFSFGINSGAYVAENIRAGIMSVDIGQTEAGLSLGLSRRTTMARIVIPQAVKNVIPAICNELIALIKETSIVSMIGMQDLTAAAKNVGAGNNLANYLAPMLVASAFYLIIVYVIAFVIKQLEKRLRASDKR